MSGKKPNRVVTSINASHYLAHLMRGGEAFIVDSELRTHAIQVNEYGEIVSHKRYTGHPEYVIPDLVASFGTKEETHPFTDML